jgi:hypothetical protein
MLFELLPAQENDADRGDEQQHADNLEGQVEIFEEGEADRGDIVDFWIGERGFDGIGRRE